MQQVSAASVVQLREKFGERETPKINGGRQRNYVLIPDSRLLLKKTVPGGWTDVRLAFSDLRNHPNSLHIFCCTF